MGVTPTPIVKNPLIIALSRDSPEILWEVSAIDANTINTKLVMTRIAIVRIILTNVFVFISFCLILSQLCPNVCVYEVVGC